MSERHIERVEHRKRGFFGHVFKWGFVGWNLLMVFWLGSYLVEVVPLIESDSNAGRAGATVGTTIGVSLIMMLWMAGAVILGLFVLLTRGKKVVVERIR